MHADLIGVEHFSTIDEWLAKRRTIEVYFALNPAWHAVRFLITPGKGACGQFIDDTEKAASLQSPWLNAYALERLAKQKRVPRVCVLHSRYADGVPGGQTWLVRGSHSERFSITLEERHDQALWLPVGSGVADVGPVWIGGVVVSLG